MGSSRFLCALTVCEPYASLIMLPDSDPRAKRIENRRWGTSYRGPLAIHAGKSRAWLRTWSAAEMPEPLGFGMMLGLVDLVDCIPLARIRKPASLGDLEWVRKHRHTEGPWCLVLEHPRRLVTPVPFSGQQLIWSVNRRVLVEQGGGFVPGPGHCRVCGCTNRYGCLHGCFWVETGLCSECRLEP